MKIFSPILKGITTVAQGTTNLSGSFTGSLLGTAATASYADNFTVGGTLTAQTINVQIITSSIEFNTGSTRSGVLSTNTHQFTGSMLVSGSVYTSGGTLQVGGTTEPGKISLFQSDSKVYSASSNFDTDLFVVRVNGSVVSNQVASLQLVASGNNGSNAGRAIISVIQTNQAISSGDIVFQNNSAGTIAERMRITSTGNVGIGVTPNSGWSLFTTLQLGGNIFSAVASSNHYLNIAANSYYDGTNFRYISNGFTSRYQLSDGTHLWYVGVSGTTGNVVSYNTAMIITNSGNLGIGASTSPVYKLEVSTAGGSERIRVGTLQNNNNTSTFEAITTQAVSSASSGWFKANAGGTMSIGTSTYTKAGGDSGNFANLSAESQTTAMTIKSNGDIQIGSQDSAVAARVAISRDAAYPGDVQPSHLSLCGVADSRKRMSLGYDTTNNYAWINAGQWGVQWTSLYIQSSGGAVYAGSARLDNNSDIRIKDNIQPITGALDKVLSMNGKKFHMLDEPESKIRLGFIAQELQGVVDELVIESDRTQTLPNGDVIENILGLETWGSSWAALLVEAIKELSAKNTLLEERLTALENN